MMPMGMQASSISYTRKTNRRALMARQAYLPAGCIMGKGGELPGRQGTIPGHSQNQSYFIAELSKEKHQCFFPG